MQTIDIINIDPSHNPSLRSRENTACDDISHRNTPPPPCDHCDKKTSCSTLRMACEEYVDYLSYKPRKFKHNTNRRIPSTELFIKKVA